MKIKISLPIILFYLFFYTYFITYIGENTNLKYIGIIIFQCYLLCNYQKFEVKKLNKSLLKIIFILIISILISLSVNFSINGMIKSFSLINLYIFTFLMLSRSPSNFYISENKLIQIITNSLLFALVFAFITQYNDIVIPLGRSSYATIRHRFGLGAESIVGFLCFIQFSLSFYLLIRKDKDKDIKDILKSIIKIIISLYMIFLADIRAAMISVLIFFLLFWYYKLPKNKVIFVIKIIFFFTSIVSFIFFILKVNLNMKILNYIFSARFLYYERAISEIIKKNAFFFGIGSFRNSKVDLLNKIQIDNSFLDIFYQYGLVCLILFLSLTFMIWHLIHKISRKQIKKKCDNLEYGIFITTYFDSIIIYSMAEKNLFSLSSALGLITFLLVFEYIEKNK